MTDRMSELELVELRNTDLGTVEIVASSPSTTTGRDGGILRQLRDLQFDRSGREGVGLKLLGRGLTRGYLHGGVGNWRHVGQIENKICKNDLQYAI